MGDETPAAPATPPKPIHEGKALTRGGIASLAPRNFQEAEHVANVLAKSDLVPKDMKGKPANVLLAIMYGAEIGISPAQALQNVMVINGRPALWGDAVMGKVLASGLVEYWKDTWDEKTKTSTFEIKRKGIGVVIRTFSMADAKEAGLDKKPGPWQQYHKRMCFHRSRSWALRDGFADVLKGISYVEEVRDIVDLEESSTGTFEMPGRKSEPAATAPATETTAEPATTEPEDPFTHTKVTGVAKADKDGSTVYIIRVGDGETKLFTREETIAELAKGSKKAGVDLLVVLEDRAGEAWIVEAKAKPKQ